MSNILQALWFYLVFCMFAGIGLPVARRLFDIRVTAWVAAKFLGLIFFAYFVWLFGFLHILNYQNHWLIGGLFFVLSALGLFLEKDFFLKDPPPPELQKNKQAKILPPKRPWYVSALILEAISLALYFGYLWLRSYNPAINGTERFMDLAMLSAAGKTNYFPFIDPWYAGKTVNYYYYGSYLMSLISNLGGIRYILSYTFSLAWLYSQASVLSGLIVYGLTKSKKFSVLGAFLVTTAGTVFFALRSFAAASGQVYSFASSTRLYTPSYIINEIPSYSFTVGDLHAHFLALPFFLLGLLLLYRLSREIKPSGLLLSAISISLATSGMINTWDLISLACLLAIVVLFKIREIKQSQVAREIRRKNIFSWLISSGVSLLAAGLLLWPYFSAYTSPVLGLGFIPDYVSRYNLANVQWPTPFSAELGMWGVFLAAILIALWVKRDDLKNYLFPLALALLSVGIIIGVEIFFIRDIYSIANPDYFRANTTFKFGYHAWTMLCLGFAIFAHAIFSDKNKSSAITTAHSNGNFSTHLPLRQVRGRRGMALDKLSWLKKATGALVVVAVAGGAVYPYQAIKQFYLTSPLSPQTLDGSAWMKQSTPDDYATVQYINNNFKSRAVIAEAVGDSYTTFSRITTYTGMITPMGWKTHEWTWRFKVPAGVVVVPGQAVETGWGAVAAVATDVQTLYQTSDVQQTSLLIKKYGIQYIYVGNMERSTYPGLNEQKFLQLGHVVFQSGDSKLYAVDD